MTVGARDIAVIANIRPNGSTYLMEDFYYAGGLKGMLKVIEKFLDTDAKTVNGKSIGENITTAEVYNEEVIRPLNNPIYPSGALVVLKGNLAPEGCVMKVSAMDNKFLKHTGPALVFDDYPSMTKTIYDENIDATEDTV